MTRWTILAVVSTLLLAGCKNKETLEGAAAPETAGQSQKAKKASTDDEKARDAGVPKEDAGVDPYQDHIIITEETPVDEIVELVKQLQIRVQEIELKEREVIQREQMVAALEESTMQQVEVLWKLKTQVQGLLEKVGEDFKDERKKYEIKKKKEEVKRGKETAEAEELRRKRAAELKQAAEEMSEARVRRIVQLAATIKGMRAAAGAEMLASMDETDAVAVLQQLGARQAAALLGNMPADKAAKLAGAMLGPKPISPEMIEEASTPAPTDGRGKGTP